MAVSGLIIILGGFKLMGDHQRMYYKAAAEHPSYAQQARQIYDECVAIDSKMASLPWPLVGVGAILATRKREYQN